MKNKGKSRMKKLIAAAMLVCMLTCSLDTGFVMPVLADDGTPTEQSVDLDTSDVDVLDVEPGVSDTTDTTVGDPVTDDTATNGVPTEQGETEENAPAEGGEEQTEQPEQQETEQPEAEQPEATQPETEQPEAEQPEAEQPEATSVSLQAEADGVKFTALNVDESFPYVNDFSNFSLTVVRSAISDVRLEDAIAETNDGDVVNLSTYDLHFFNGSNEVVPNSNVSVMVENAGILPEEGQWIQTYFYNKADGTAKKCPTQWNKSSGAVTVTVKDNGEYALTVLKVKDGIRLTTVANDVEITLTAPADAFPQEGELTLAAEEITDERLEQAKATIEEKMFKGNQEIKSYRLFDVTPMLDGAEVQPAQPVRISFKNLVLTDEEGITTDVREKLEEEGKIVTEDNEIPADDIILKETKEKELVATNREEIKAYHFEDEETPEEINTVADTQEVVTELEHFSWVLYAKAGASGEAYDATVQNYETEAHDPYPYSLDYILRHYNVFCSGDYLGTHVVGPMVVGGQTMLHGSLGGVTQDIKPYVHTAPSYLEGYAYNEDNPDSFPEIITARDDQMPVYVGQSNNVLNSHKVNHKPNYWTAQYVNGATENNPVDPKTMYVNFAEAFPTNVPAVGANGKELLQDTSPGATNNLPEYKVIKKAPGEKEVRPWDVDDGENYISAKTSKIEPNGLIYGERPVDGNGKPIGSYPKGTINYYRNFDGYDAGGNPVRPVSIPSSLFDEILKETNDGTGKDADGETELKGDNALQTDRRLGYSRYYTLDKQGKVVPCGTKDDPTSLNGMNGGRGATPADFDNPDLHLSKDSYAFCIDTKNTQFKYDAQGGQVSGAMDTIDVSIRLRPGYNFTFDKFETGWSNETVGRKPGTDGGTNTNITVNGRVQNIVYDYINADEMANRLMIISTDEQTEQLVIPRIYKSVADDAYGHNYQFDSIEHGLTFSALWFAPYVREVYVGFTDPWARKDATNGSKMVGHLVVPQADVWLGGGDFNGGVIARNINASSVGSEGHMWPFVVGTAINGVHIAGEKHVDGVTPAADEKFFFKYTLTRPDKTIVKDVISNQSDGKFDLNLMADNADSAINEPGEYKIEVSEVKSYADDFDKYASDKTKADLASKGFDATKLEDFFTNSKYKFDKKKYQGTFTIKVLQEEVLPETTGEREQRMIVDPSTTKVTWKVDYGDGKWIDYGNDTLSFNNTTTSKLNVVKEWYDADGKKIEKPTKDPITFDLYRDSTPPTGHKINVNIYSTYDPGDTSITKLIRSELVGYVDDGKSVTFGVQLNDKERLKSQGNNWPSAGICTDVYTPGQAQGMTYIEEKGLPDGKHAIVTRDNTDYQLSADGLPGGTDITVSNVYGDIVVNVVFRSTWLDKNNIKYTGSATEAAEGEELYGYTGGYSTDNYVDVDVKVDDQGKIEKHTIRDRVNYPTPDKFVLNYGSSNQDAWNVPPFTQKKQAIDPDTNSPMVNDKKEPIYETTTDKDGNTVYVMEHVPPCMDPITIGSDDEWTKVFNDLPPRDENGNPYYYKVVEHDIGGNYTTKYVGNITRITGATTPTITIKNEVQRGVKLLVNKVVDGGNTKILNDSAEFQLYELGSYTPPKTTENPDPKPVETRNIVTFYDKEDHYEYSSSKHNLGATDTLKTKDGFWDISFLPHGKYVLVETKSPAGYEGETRDMYIDFSKDVTPTYWFKNGDTETEHKNVPTGTGGDENVIAYTYDFANKAKGGPELPNSGGPGFRMFTIGGISFIAISLMIIYYEIARRRKEDLVQVKQTYHKNKM